MTPKKKKLLRWLWRLWKWLGKMKNTCAKPATELVRVCMTELGAGIARVLALNNQRRMNMTSDEIIEMARQFGLSVGVALDGSKSMGKHEDKSFAVGRLPLEDFVAFVQLVAAKEREKFLRLSTKAKDVDENCDIVLAADIRGDKA